MLVAAAVALIVLSGCSSAPGHDAAAGDVAARFSEALSTGDMDAACRLLAAGTLTTLKDDHGQPCSEALLTLELPSGGTVSETKAYARAAESTLTSDVVFLTLESNGWKVTAAGCTARPGMPYRCELEGA